MLESFFNKVADLKVCNFIKKGTLTLLFFCEYGEIFKHSFFHKTPPVVAFGSHETNGSIRLWNFTPLLTVDQIFQKQPFPDVFQNRC